MCQYTDKKKTQVRGKLSEKSGEMSTIEKGNTNYIFEKKEAFRFLGDDSLELMQDDEIRSGK